MSSGTILLLFSLFFTINISLSKLCLPALTKQIFGWKKRMKISHIMKDSIWLINDVLKVIYFMLVSLSSQEKLKEIDKKKSLTWSERSVLSSWSDSSSSRRTSRLSWSTDSDRRLGPAEQILFVFAGPTVPVLVAPVGSAGPQTLTVGWALQSKVLAVFAGPSVPVLVAPVGSAGPQTLTVG
jgi:hypothetical protein